MKKWFKLASVATLAIAAMSTGSASAATIVHTISGTGSGSLAGNGFTNSAYTLGFTSEDRSNTPTSVFFQIANNAAVTLNISTAFGTAFDTFYLQNLSSRFRSDFFDFTLPDPNLDVYAPFPAVTGTNVRALNGFANIDTSGGALTLTSSFSVQFAAALQAVPAVPEPASWAMMVLGLGAVGTALRRRPKVRVTFA